MAIGAVMIQAATPQTRHIPKLDVVSRIGLDLIDSIKSDTLQDADPVHLDGRFMNKGISKICSGVTTMFIATAMLVIAALNIRPRIVVQNANVAKVDNAGIGKTPPQNPTATDNPICKADNVLAGTINLSFSQFRRLVMIMYGLGEAKIPNESLGEWKTCGD